MGLLKPRWAKAVDQQVDRTFAGYKDDSLDEVVVRSLINSVVQKVEHAQRARFANPQHVYDYAAARVNARWSHKTKTT